MDNQLNKKLIFSKYKKKDINDEIRAVNRLKLDLLSKNDNLKYSFLHLSFALTCLAMILIYIVLAPMMRAIAFSIPYLVLTGVISGVELKNSILSLKEYTRIKKELKGIAILNLDIKGESLYSKLDSIEAEELEAKKILGEEGNIILNSIKPCEKSTNLEINIKKRQIISELKEQKQQLLELDNQQLDKPTKNKVLIRK